MIDRMDELINIAHKSELLRKEANYAALQAQIKPHFLYNTLESLRMMADTNGDKKLSQMCFVFGRLIRYSLTGADERVSLEQELAHARYYLQISRLRMGDRLSFEVESEPRLTELTCPKFILQPLVENAITHGLSRQSRPGVVRVELRSLDGRVQLVVTDNGQGIEPKRLEDIQAMLRGDATGEPLRTETGGLGLSNVHERVRIAYGEDAGLAIASETGVGTVCTLTLHERDGERGPDGHEAVDRRG